jgi:hypothetical protein
MTRLTSPQATPQDIEDALAEEDRYIRAALAVGPAYLSPAQILHAWRATAAEVRAHTPPTVFYILQSFSDRLVRL